MSIPSQTTRSKTWIIPRIIGLALGIALASAALVVSVQERSRLLGIVLAPSATHGPIATQSTPAPPPSTSPTPTSFRRTPSPAPSRTPEPTQPALDADIRKVEDEIGVVDDAVLRTDLQALLATKVAPTDQARIFADLGNLETRLGHLYLASGYFEQTYALQKTAENLIKLADADAAVNKYEQARMRYMELLDWTGAAADLYRDSAKTGLERVNLMLQGSAY